VEVAGLDVLIEDQPPGRSQGTRKVVAKKKAPETRICKPLQAI
jgi:hypothetical protein